MHQCNCWGVALASLLQWWQGILDKASALECALLGQCIKVKSNYGRFFNHCAICPFGSLKFLQPSQKNHSRSSAGTGTPEDRGWSAYSTPPPPLAPAMLHSTASQFCSRNGHHRCQRALCHHHQTETAQHQTHWNLLLCSGWKASKNLGRPGWGQIPGALSGRQMPAHKQESSGKGCLSLWDDGGARLR